jgi:hypothetical protein
LSEQDDAENAKSLRLDEKAAREELYGPETLTVAVESYVEYLSRSGQAAERYLERRGLFRIPDLSDGSEGYDLSALTQDEAMILAQLHAKIRRRVKPQG